jgi:hypothetical protein
MENTANAPGGYFSGLAVAEYPGWFQTTLAGFGISGDRIGSIPCIFPIIVFLDRVK